MLGMSSTDLSDKSRVGLYDLQRKNNQSRLAGSAGMSQEDTANAVEGIIQADAAGKATRERTTLEAQNAADQIALRREEIAGTRAEAFAGMAKQNEHWNKANDINDARYSEQRKDALLQRKIENITTAGSALGTIGKAYYQPKWGDTIKNWFAKFMPQSQSVTPQGNFTQSSNPSLGIKKSTLGAN